MVVVVVVVPASYPAKKQINIDIFPLVGYLGRERREEGGGRREKSLVGGREERRGCVEGEQRGGCCTFPAPHTELEKWK